MALLNAIKELATHPTQSASKQQSEVHDSVQALLEKLTPDRLRMLASLADTSVDYQRAVLTTLPDGVQDLLVTLSLAHQTSGQAYELTPLGRRVAGAAATEENPEADIPDDLDDRVAALRDRLVDVELPFEPVPTSGRSADLSSGC